MRPAPLRAVADADNPGWMIVVKIGMWTMFAVAIILVMVVVLLN
ncbi:hypothetical protein BH11MYX3_BH11MYX3_12080 [soil metagenome]